jgi:hypothetical protein
LSSQSSNAKAIFVNFSVIVLFFGICEIFFWHMQNNDTGGSEVIYSHSNKSAESFTVEHDILGYAPVKNNEISVTKLWKDGSKINVKFTIDADGLRKSNKNRNTDYKESIVFFGCSYTFGASLNDEETAPFQAGVLSGDKYKIYNFGFPGYGTHQMLSAIEKGLVERVVDIHPKYVIYQALPDHINRLLGQKKWDSHGPKYLLDTDKKIKNVGHFDDSKSSIRKRLEGQFKKSYLYRRITERTDISPHDIDLFAGMVSVAKNSLKKLYPASEFHVIFWDIGPWIVPEGLPKMILQSLESDKISVHRISNILLNYNEKTYFINQYDSHPNPIANKIIAEYIAKHIIR